MNTTKVGDIAAAWAAPPPQVGPPRRETSEPRPVQALTQGTGADEATKRNLAESALADARKAAAAAARKREAARPVAVTRQVGFEGPYGVVVDLLAAQSDHRLFRVFGRAPESVFGEAAQAYGAANELTKASLLHATA